MVYDRALQVLPLLVSCHFLGKIVAGVFSRCPSRGLGFGVSISHDDHVYIYIYIHLYSP